MDKLREFDIEGEITSLNKYIDAERGNKFQGSKIKKFETSRVMYACVGVLPVRDECYPVRIAFHWRVKDRMQDPDNIAFARKFILDGMQLGRVIAGDGYKFLSGGFEDHFSVDAKNPGVTVIIYGEE